MSESNDKLAAIQTWINEFRENRIADLDSPNIGLAILDEIADLILVQTPSTPLAQAISDTYVDLERRVEEQSLALTRATTTLKAQITERESAALKLRKAYNDLETHLQEHVTYQSKLNQSLQEQIQEQKRSQALEQEERALTEALRDTLTTIGSTLDLDKILDHILDTVARVAPYDGANVLLVESDLVHMVRQKGYVEQGQDKEWLNRRIPLTRLASLQQLMDIGKPMAIANTASSPLWIGFPDLDWVCSNVIAPIRSNGKVLGFLSLDSATPGFFTQAHAERLQTFADQAAIAIQNARLLDRAKRAAVLAERNRLANELHDTISQTLWSISLITERLPNLWEANNEQGRRSLTTLHQLAQNALAEMRVLLLELHPATLTNKKLGDLIRQAAEITANRTDLNISVQIGQQDPVPPEVHLSLYRVAQESLNNIALHALATHVEIVFNSHAGRIDFSIWDDGVGFDPAKIGPGHLGISIMQDRIQNIGGTIEVDSQKGKWTSINVCWTAPKTPSS